MFTFPNGATEVCHTKSLHSSGDTTKTAQPAGSSGSHHHRPRQLATPIATAKNNNNNHT